MTVIFNLSTLESKKKNKQAKQKQIHKYREHFNGCQMRGGLEGINKYKLVFTEQSWGYKVQHREYS